jgi:hypothetical protein
LHYLKMAEVIEAKTFNPPPPDGMAILPE